MTVAGSCLGSPVETHMLVNHCIIVWSAQEAQSCAIHGACRGEVIECSAPFDAEHCWAMVKGPPPAKHYSGKSPPAANCRCTWIHSIDGRGRTPPTARCRDRTRPSPTRMHLRTSRRRGMSVEASTAWHASSMMTVWNPNAIRAKNSCPLELSVVNTICASSSSFARSWHTHIDASMPTHAEAQAAAGRNQPIPPRCAARESCERCCCHTQLSPEMG